MTVRCKMRCTQVTAHDGETATVRLEAVKDGSPEDEVYGKYTPWGDISMGIDNDAAVAEFEVGQMYYVDFNRAT